MGIGGASGVSRGPDEYPFCQIGAEGGIRPRTGADIGLKYFLADAGFDLEKIEVGQWRNRRCAIANFQRKWKRWYPRLHSLENQPLYPVSVWAFAKK